MSAPPVNTPLVCGCEEVFYEVNIIIYHVTVKPGCLQFWGGSIDSLRAKVKSLRNAWQYAKRKDVLNKKSQEKYASNPEPWKKKMKEAYSANPEAKIKKVMQHLAGQKDKDTEFALKNFEKAGR